MSTFKDNQYEGKEIIVDESNKDVKTIVFLGNGVIIQILAEDYPNVKKELKEAFGEMKKKKDDRNLGELTEMDYNSPNFDDEEPLQTKKKKKKQ